MEKNMSKMEARGGDARTIDRKRVQHVLQDNQRGGPKDSGVEAVVAGVVAVMIAAYRPAGSWLIDSALDEAIRVEWRRICGSAHLSDEMKALVRRDALARYDARPKP